MYLILSIALPIPADKLFDYYVESDETLHVGKRALVPFGSRKLTGVVVKQRKEKQIDKLKHVTEILDEIPIFPRNLLELTKWISEYYICSWGESLKAALPTGMSPESVLKVSVINYPGKEEIEKMIKKAPKRAQLLQEILKSNDFVTVNSLSKRLNSKSINAQLEALKDLGYIEVTRVVEGDIKSKTEKGIFIPKELFEDDIKLKSIFDKLDNKAPKQSSVLSSVYLYQMKHDKAVTKKLIMQQTGSALNSINSLIKKEILKEVDIEVERHKTMVQESLAIRDESVLKLTNEQELAIESINYSLESNTKKNYLLHGITGSGKTLVYIQAVKKCFSLGKTALLLVPEISLTPQLIDRFEKVFPGDLVAIHSKMSQGERYDSWQAVRKGKVKLVIGARSAIFAPLENIGLIIVDEEHETSYKQDSPAPRYQGRDVAIIRSKIENATLILGSATPSIESYYNMKKGRFTLLEITERADGAVLPIIKTIDMLDAKKQNRINSIFSEDLLNEIKERVTKSEGTIIFQNRRGFSSMLLCDNCGNVPMCPNCDITLTYHKAKDQLKCHYCGYISAAFKTCNVCGQQEMIRHGTGTQKVEEELYNILKDDGIEANIKRLDLDTTSRKGSFRKILTDFKKGEIDILIGTQMVAKGLDFDRVTLVGIINADAQLYIPDFRANERTYQIITQVSGRAGRTGEKPGKVIIQSYNPTNQVLQNSINNNYKSFYEDEIKSRLEAIYPPFVRFVVIEFTGLYENLVVEHANYFAEYLPTNEKSLLIMGPVTPEVSRLKKKYRQMIIIKNIKKYDPKGDILRNILHKANEKYKMKNASNKIQLKIDIDSYSSI